MSSGDKAASNGTAAGNGTDNEFVPSIPLDDWVSTNPPQRIKHTPIKGSSFPLSRIHWLSTLLAVSSAKEGENQAEPMFSDGDRSQAVLLPSISVSVVLRSRNNARAR